MHGAIESNKLFMFEFLLNFHQGSITVDIFKDLLRSTLERNRDSMTFILLSHPYANICDQSERESLFDWYRRPLTLNEFLSHKIE